MKETKFIELLNLYVDHQISADDAALLESEVRTNPDRRRVYRQYCMIQKGCTRLGEAFRTEAPALAGAPAVIEFKPRRRSYGIAAYAASFGAMAACILLAVVLRPGEKLEIPATAAALTPQLPPPVATTAQASPARPALHPAVGPRSFGLREQNTEFDEASPALYQVAFGDWMNEVRLPAMDEVSIDDLRFDGHAPLPTERDSIRGARPFQGRVENVAVRFQK